MMAIRAFLMGEGRGCEQLRRERDFAQERCITLERILALYRPKVPFAITDEKMFDRLSWYLGSGTAGKAEQLLPNVQGYMHAEHDREN